MTEPFDLTAFQEAATSMHEMFKTLVEAGFTENQALRLVAEMVRTSAKDNDGTEST